VWREQQTGCSAMLLNWTQRPWTLNRSHQPQPILMDLEVC
jgi:hypothetical protein